MADHSSTTVQLQTCVPLQQLFDGPSGSVSVGRMSTGTEAGREVFMRRVKHLAADELESEVHAASMVTHPSLMKVLGLAAPSDTTNDRGASDLYVISEFMVGASLLQIAAAAKLPGCSLAGSVRLRIVHDALLAAFEARRILRQASRWLVRRTIFADTIWVTDFGAVLLSEVGVSQRLHRSERDTASGVALGSAADADVAAAGSVLRLLFTDQQGHLAVPAPYQEAVAPILAGSEGSHAKRFGNPKEMARALADLPAGLVATEGEVGAAMRTLLHAQLIRQRVRLGLPAQGQEPGARETATQVFDANALVQRWEQPTQRPPVVFPEGDGAERPSGDVTRIMPEVPRPPPASPRPPGTTSPDFRGDENDMTRIFVPVFGASGPEATRSVAEPEAPPHAPATDASAPRALTHRPPSGEITLLSGTQGVYRGTFERRKSIGVALATLLILCALLWWSELF